MEVGGGDLPSRQLGDRVAQRLVDPATGVRPPAETVVRDLEGVPSLEERREMVEDDGMVRVTCEYCSRRYSVWPAELETA